MYYINVNVKFLKTSSKCFIKNKNKIKAIHTLIQKQFKNVLVI